MKSGDVRCEKCGVRRRYHGPMWNDTHAFVEPARREKRKAYLKAWTLHTRDNKWAQLVGRVYGHPKYEDDTLVTTSPILRLDIPGQMAETMNTIYVLEGRRE